MSHYLLSGYAEVSPQVLKDRLKYPSSGCFLVQGMGPLAVHGHAKFGRLLFAHGAGAGQQSFFMRQFVTSLADREFKFCVLIFPICNKCRKPANADHRHLSPRPLLSLPSGMRYLILCLKGRCGLGEVDGRTRGDPICQPTAGQRTIE